MADKIRVAIIGGSGYTGAELLRLLSAHPHVEIVAVTSRAEQGRRVDALFPHLRGHTALSFSAPDISQLGRDADLVFFATPHGAAMSAVPQILAAGARVIDLSADFRLRDQAVWEHWYDQPHEAADLLPQAVYGLPEQNREQLKSADLIACAGCYPTSVQLALLPLLREGLIQAEGIIADCKSGTSGAGRSAKIGSLLCEAGDNFHAYASAGHRHLPEIEQGLSDIAGQPVSCHFVPHLLPMIRGIHSTVYADASEHALDLQALYESFYADEPFVDVMPLGSHPETRSVRASNVARLSIRRLGNKVLVMAVIDNLVKGASGQAIQCMNIAFGFDEVLGLEAPAILP